MLRITAYADRLLADLDGLDWPESLKEMQRNWIGRSEGAEVDFTVLKLVESGTGNGEAIRVLDEKLTVFTTRPDTLFGATYMVLAPEHPLVEQITMAERFAEVKAYRESVANKSDLERTELAKTKTGVFTGGYAVNPVNGAEIEIWIADYVMMGYGTGAIMAVPAHDERDNEFARKFHLKIVEVVKAPESAASDAACFAGNGTAINSGFLDGLPTAEAKAKMIDWLEEKGVGKRRVQYKLRDWLFSRQRYWGEPFPILWKGDQHEPLPESELPLLLPELADYTPSAEGRAPLSKATDWLNLPDGRVRETNTMPQWAGSCWYYLRYCDPKNPDRMIDPAIEKYWMGDKGVDLYIGGAEHAVLHLLYARFWHKVLFDLGVVSTSEPFHKLVNQGIILGEDNRKMSKAWGNVVNPDDVIAEYGADALRLFEMFMGPLEQMKPWSTKGVEGVYGFLGRVWRLVMEEDQEGQWHFAPAKVTDAAPSDDTLHAVHAAIAKVAAMLPANANETDLAAQSIAARAQAEDILRLLRENAGDLALVIRLNAQYASMVRTSLSVHAHLMRVQAVRQKREAIGGTANHDAWTQQVAEQSMLKVTDREIEWQQAARLKAAPVAAPAPAPQEDQSTNENVSETNTNPHDAAFETWMSEQSWNQTPGSQDETGLSKLFHEAMAGSRLAGRELPADGRESPLGPG